MMMRTETKVRHKQASEGRSRQRTMEIPQHIVWSVGSVWDGIYKDGDDAQKKVTYQQTLHLKSNQ